MSRWSADQTSSVTVATEVGNAPGYDNLRPATIRAALERAPAPAGNATALRAAMSATVAAGATGVIARYDDGEEVTALALGQARLTPPRPLAVVDQARVGSITKSMVATVALQLVGEGGPVPPADDRLTDTASSSNPAAASSSPAAMRASPSA